MGCSFLFERREEWKKKCAVIVGGMTYSRSQTKGFVLIPTASMLIALVTHLVRKDAKNGG